MIFTLKPMIYRYYFLYEFIYASSSMYRVEILHKGKTIF